MLRNKHLMKQFGAATHSSEDEIEDFRAVNRTRGVAVHRKKDGELQGNIQSMAQSASSIATDTASPRTLHWRAIPDKHKKRAISPDLVDHYVPSRGLRTPKRRKTKSAHNRSRNVSQPPKATLSQQLELSEDSGYRSTVSAEPVPRNGFMNTGTSNLDAEDQETSDQDKFVIGVDFGTTYTTVAICSQPKNEPHRRALPEDVECIRNWPRDNARGVLQQVPTEIWYPPTPRARPRLQAQIDLDDSQNESDTPDSNEEQMSSSSNAGIAQSSASRAKPESAPYIYGFDSVEAVRNEKIVRDPSFRIERPKILLLSAKYTKKDRVALRPQIDFLISEGIIRKYGKKGIPNAYDSQDVIADYLTEILKHVSQQLIRMYGKAPSSVSFVLNVPVIWSPQSSRLLQCAMEDAIRRSGFATDSLLNGSIDNLYIVSEPDAALKWLLAKATNIEPGNKIAVLDCGGGTVDCSAHEIGESFPLSLKTQIGRPNGDNCGGSYLNDRYADRLLQRLRGEEYLTQIHGQSIEMIVQGLLQRFESFHKKDQDLRDRPTLRVRVTGLRPSMSKRFDDGYLNLNPADFDSIFNPILERIWAVLEAQLQLINCESKKVFLVGGFGGAPSVKSYIASRLDEFSRDNKLPQQIQMVAPDNEYDSSTTVACGSVLHHLDFNDCGRRLAHSSYGFLRREYYNPGTCPAHKGTTPYTDEWTGELMVKVIDYFMVKGKRISRRHEFKPIRCIHGFPLYETVFECAEVVYVSDHANTSHYSYNHQKNATATLLDKVSFSMAHLKDQGRLERVDPEPDEDGTTRGEPHYKVEFDLYPIAEGRNLRYEARDVVTHEVIGQGQVSIAAAFKPGTF